MDSPQSSHERFLSHMETHQRALLKVCWAYGSTSHDRDDLLQEMASRLWSAYGRYDPERKFSTWMYRIALNVAIDWSRRQRRLRKETTTLQEAAIIDNSDASDKERNEQLADLRELLDQQNEPDRAILFLHLESYTHREIGEVIGLSESNVGTRLSRIKASLRVAVIEQNQIHEGAK